jgi:uncharacterized membrane protein
MRGHLVEFNAATWDPHCPGPRAPSPLDYPDAVTASGRAPSRLHAWVLPVVSAVLLIVVLLLPDLGPRASGPEPVAAYHARIVALLDPHRQNPADPGSGFLPDARVLMLEGPQSGREVEAYLEGPGGQQSGAAYRVGDEVVVTSTGSPQGPPFVAVSDRWRLPQLGFLAAAFALAVIVVGGWRGLRALLALALTIAVIIRVLVPLLLQGVPPIPVAVVIATVITILTVGLTEGFSRAGVAAILGTTGALGLTALLAAVATVASGFTNAAGTDLAYLQTAEGQGLDLRGLLLAAFMLGAIGVLDDVTVTQGATVEELARHAGLRGRRLFASAFNVGRSHIAATVNTLFLAYVGASLPLLVLFAVSRQPTILTLNGELVSVEIVRTLVGSLGIIAAVPLTTAIATWLVSESAPAADEPGRRGRRPARAVQRPLVALAGGLVVIGLLVGAATAGLGPFIASGPLTPLTPTILAPSASPSGPPPSEALPTESDFGPGPTLVTVLQVGEVQSVTEGTSSAAISVVEARVPPASDGPLVVDVRIRYVGTTDFTIRPSAWVALTSDGDDIEPTPGTGSAPELTGGPLRAGETREGWLQYRLEAKGEDLFLDYRLPDDSTVFSVEVY